MSLSQFVWGQVFNMGLIILQVQITRRWYSIDRVCVVSFSLLLLFFLGGGGTYNDLIILPSVDLI